MALYKVTVIRRKLSKKKHCRKSRVLSERLKVASDEESRKFDENM